MRFEPASIAVSAIAGVSPLNARHDMADDPAIERELLPSIVETGGPMEPPILVRDSGDENRYLVLAGRRRFRATRMAIERGLLPAGLFLRAQIFHGTEAQAREVELFSDNKLPLSPARKARLFRDLAASMTPAQIAGPFGETEKGVRALVALGGVAAEILDAWEKGTIQRPAVEAYSLAADHDAQRKLFADPALRADARRIRDLLRGDAMPASHEYALYVGAEAYLAKGGRIREDLFSDRADWIDGGILRALAEAKLIAEAEKVRKAEKWGWAKTGFDAADLVNAPECEPDYTDAEEREKDEIRAAFVGVKFGDPAWSDLSARMASIEGKAACRAVPEARRRKLGILATIMVDGRVEYERAQETAAMAQSRREKEARDNASATAGKPLSRAAGEGGSRSETGEGAGDGPDDANPAAARRLREGFDNALRAALAELLAARVDIAFALDLMINVAPEEATHPLLVALREADEADDCGRATFSRAAGILARAPLADITAAWCALQAGSADVLNDDVISSLATLAIARGAPVAQRMLELTSPETISAAAISGAMDGFLTKIIDAAALPSPQGGEGEGEGVGPGEHPTIAKDPDPAAAHPFPIAIHLKDFLARKCRRVAGARTPSQAFTDAFSAWTSSHHNGETWGIHDVKPAMLAEGIEQKRTAKGAVWMGVEIAGE